MQSPVWTLPAEQGGLASNDVAQKAHTASVRHSLLAAPLPERHARWTRQDDEERLVETTMLEGKL